MRIRLENIDNRFLITIVMKRRVAVSGGDFDEMHGTISILEVQREKLL